MHYLHFTAEDFVADAYFSKWVFDPDQPTQAFWSQWLQEHQEKRAEVEQARQILRSLRFNYYRASQEDLQEVWDQIQAKYNNSQPVAVQVHNEEDIGVFDNLLNIA